MKRKALLIGYNALECPEEDTLYNVPNDLDKIKHYLMSPNGGAWIYDINKTENNEIEIFHNVSREFLKSRLNDINTEKPDVGLIYITGHGAFSDKYNCRKFKLNKNEHIYESELIGIADKEIFIWDSCSCNVSEVLSSKANLINTEIDKIISPDIFDKARKKYFELCNMCKEQKIKLYAAIKGTCAQDINGGVFTNALIDVSKKYTSIDIKKAYEKAATIVKNITNDSKHGKQIPSISVNSNIDKFLPWSIDIK